MPTIEEILALDLDVQDKELLERIEHDVVVSYLDRRGWSTLEKSNEDVTIMGNKRGEWFRVWVPRRRDFADYSSGMKRVVGTITDYEERTQLQVIFDLLKEKR